MADQFTFADLVWKNKGKTTRREEFLSEMDRVTPGSGSPGSLPRIIPQGRTVALP